MSIDCHGLTHPGLIREENQDQFLIAELGRALVVHDTSIALDRSPRRGPSHGQLFAVADGVGGSSGGAVASGRTLEALLDSALHLFPGAESPGPRDLAPELHDALARCRADVLRAAAAEPRDRRMATTLTLAYVLWPEAWILHVGDSRAYLARGTRLTQLTKDQTVAAELAAAGAITESGVRRSRWRNTLSNTVGAGPNRAPYVTRVELSPGDTLLLCSDGLTEHVSDEEIHELLSQAPSSAEACERLVEAANAGGGSDNVTCVVARFADADPSEADTVRLPPVKTGL